MSEKILCVDDDFNLLSACQRNLRHRFHIDTAIGGAQGLLAVSVKGPYAVVVSDLRMPGMSGIQFLSRVRECSPDSVRIMLTGYADLDTAIQAVNEGNIFRFLTKPYPPENLAMALEAGIEQYRLVMAERELLEKTLRGSVTVLTEILSLVSPVAFARAMRVRRLVEELANALGAEDTWKIELAAMLSQVGCVTVPDTVLEKANRGDALTEQESRMFRSHPRVGRDLIAHIPRLEDVAEIVYYQDKHYNGQGIPTDDRSGDALPLGARVLHVALDFDALVASGDSPEAAYTKMKSRAGCYEPRVVEVLAAILGINSGTKTGLVRQGPKSREPLLGLPRAHTKYEVKGYPIEELTTCMVLAEDVRSETGALLIAKGQEVTPSLKTRLLNYARTTQVQQPIKVLEFMSDPGRSKNQP